ncbi:MAG: UbiA family prenyltransferase [Chloroflexaceae bacterium]|nr:UbiA family prenyltransferase [Chloroflexaceae bacterium]
MAHRPYRPVPRGLVSLHELCIVAAGAALVQLALVLWLAPALLTLLLLLWCYMALMSIEFGVGHWLKRQPVLYLLSHMLVVPLLALYLSGWDWLRAGVAPPPGLGWLLALSFCNGLAIEIGRKLRAPHEEEPGVETYSVLWGRQAALFIWLGVLLLAALCAAGLAWTIGNLWPVGVALVALVAAVLVALRFMQHPRARLIEAMTGVWTLALYGVIGVLPLLG